MRIGWIQTKTIRYLDAFFNTNAGECSIQPHFHGADAYLSFAFDLIQLKIFFKRERFFAPVQRSTKVALSF